MQPDAHTFGFLSRQFSNYGRVVLCSEQGAARIRKTLPPDVELIVSDRTLDHGGLELLRDLLIRLEQTAT